MEESNVTFPYDRATQMYPDWHSDQLMKNKYAKQKDLSKSLKWKKKSIREKQSGGPSPSSNTNMQSKDRASRKSASKCLLVSPTSKKLEDEKRETKEEREREGRRYPF